MLKIDTDDLAAAKKDMDDLHEKVSSVASMQSSVDVSGTNSGEAANSEAYMASAWIAVASALADGLEKYANNLGQAHNELTGDLSTKRSDVATKLGGSVTNSVCVTYDDSAGVGQDVINLDQAFASLGASVNSAWSQAGRLDGNEAVNIVNALTGLGTALSNQQSAVDNAKKAWDNYGNAMKDFDNRYNDLFSRSIVGDIPNWTKSLPGKVTDKLSKFLSDFIKYTHSSKALHNLRDPDEILKSFKSTFKDFLPYHTYMSKHQHVKGYVRDDGTKVRGYSKARERPVLKDLREARDCLEQGKWKVNGAKGINKYLKSNKFKAIGKYAGIANKGLGVAGKAIDVYTVGSKGVGAFLGTNGSFGQKLGAGLKASGKEGVKVGVSTAVTAAATIGVGALLAGLTGSFAPLVVAGAQVGASILINHAANAAGGAASGFIFGR
ncbi:hypothetical protein OZX67_07205 [Bifidobacterium sp. ESL0728]|uniref:hypothetical protein n=1 Tax=Bifidobacterium sp. ESL0728 TaxID=2983220 RepID=UPI0023F6918A|nr:hypothetical protein [Bifidobacterium sp. ESL0728]WEV58585.1 hypothetical protein OZX67_07205 [Bifidobacterium sp. ESL0728]